MIENRPVPSPPGVLGEPKARVIFYSGHQDPVDDIVRLFAIEHVIEQEFRQDTRPEVGPGQVVVVLQRLRCRIEPRLAVPPQSLALVTGQFAVFALDTAHHLIDECGLGGRFIPGLRVEE